MKVLVVDDNTHYWEIVSPSFEKSGIELNICEHEDVAEMLSLPTQYDWVIIHESGSTGDSLIPKLKRLRISADHQVPCVIVNNRQQDLKQEKNRWKSLDSVFDIRTVLPLPLTPDSLTNLIPQSNSEVAKLLELLPLPARMLDLDRHILATNTEWNWGKTIPDSKAVSADTVEFSTSLKGGHVEFWVLQEMVQGPTNQILQIAHRHYRPSPINSEASGIEAVEEASSYLWALLKSLGAKRMRFYLRRSVPDAEGTLTLLMNFGAECPQFESFSLIADQLDVACWKSSYGIVTTVIDGEVVQTFNNLRRDSYQKRKSGHLSYKVFSTKRSSEAESSAIRLFHKALGISDQSESLYIPVVIDNQPGLRAIAVADCGDGKIDAEFEELIERRQPSILLALDKIKRALNALGEMERARVWKDAWNIVQHEMPDELTEMSKEKFVSGVIKRSLKLCNVTFASIGWQRFPGTIPKILALELDESAYNLAGIEKRKKLVGQPCNVDELPAIHSAISTKLPFFHQNGSDLHASSDINDALPRFALPIKVAGSVRGALGLSVSSKNYSFSQLDVDRAQVLVDLLGPVLYFLDSVLVSRIWHSTLHHEVLSNLNPTIRYMKKLSNSEERDISLWFAQDLLDSFSKLSPDLKKATRFDALGVLKSEIANSEVIARKNFKRFFDLSFAVQEFEVFSEKAIWTFSVRTLLSNSLRHGDKKSDGMQPITVTCEVSDNMLKLVVTNEAPQLTDEEVSMAFERGVILTGDRQSDGSHTALSDARSVLREYGGDLKLVKLEKDGKVFAQATASIPQVDCPEKFKKVEGVK